MERKQFEVVETPNVVDTKGHNNSSKRTRNSFSTRGKEGRIRFKNIFSLWIYTSKKGEKHNESTASAKKHAREDQ